jgi:hypothetical protein
MLDKEFKSIIFKMISDQPQGGFKETEEWSKSV